MTNPISIQAVDHALWDWAGVDGLLFGQAIFGDAIAKLAPFQSVDLSLDQVPCAVLRLGEGNFRVAIAHEAPFLKRVPDAKGVLKVWVKPCNDLSAIALPEAEGLNLLPRIATTKPIFNLEAIAPNCAIPARIQGMSVLVWRHRIHQAGAIELQMARLQQDTIQQQLHAL